MTAVATTAATLALVATIAAVPAPSVDAATAQLAWHYVFVRVDTGDGGALATDAQAAVAATGTIRYWASVPGAPAVTVTVVHQTLHGAGTYPSCGFTVGRAALTAAGTPAAAMDGVVTFLRTGYPCPRNGIAHADQPGLDVEAFGGAPLLTWRAVAHEVGHNLGLCAGTVHDRQAPSRWTPVEFTGPTSYGNPFSIMGGGTGPPSAPCQAAAGWLTPSPLLTGATVKVRALEGATGGRAWQFRARGHTWTVEYRSRPTAAPTLGPTTGVALYMDGLIVETAGDRYVLPAGWVHPAPTIALRIVAVRPGYTYVQRL